ncbi:MAG: serine--tRNA ligase [Rhodothermaceae bacterium]|nr:serine--tRNA ligase [Rhodothermaceae bacterium]MBC13688.1 serine--tRNA ligase [Rhodothermaceae bacterium]
MIDLDLLRDDPDRVRRSMEAKRLGDPATVGLALDLDTRRREAVTTLNRVQQRQGELGREIGPLMKAGKRDEAASLLAESNAVKAQARDLEETVRGLDAELRDAMLAIPNPIHESVPVGGEDANVVEAEIGEVPTFDFEPLPHWDLCERHGLVDFERGAKVTGAGFPFYIGQGARLQRALIALFLDLATEVGYTEVQAPILVNEASGIGTGQLPDKEGQMYHTAADDLYMVPTAEVPLTNYLRDEILPPDVLPIKYTGYTPCFRREAGSYGKDVRGLNRLHQFDKVELVRFVHPDESYEHLEELREDAERAVQALDLPYRRLVLASGDLGVTQAKTYDLEVWSAGQGRWLEVSSVSNFESYQARRANVRFRPAEGEKPQFVHTLNGSGLALPRIVAALLENGQQADGSIVLPERLAAYAGFDRIG